MNAKLEADLSNREITYLKLTRNWNEYITCSCDLENALHLQHRITDHEVSKFNVGVVRAFKTTFLVRLTLREAVLNALSQLISRLENRMNDMLKDCPE